MRRGPVTEMTRPRQDVQGITTGLRSRSQIQRDRHLIFTTCMA